MEHIIPAALEPWQAGTSYAKGTALTANTIYAVAAAVGTYAFAPPPLPQDGCMACLPRVQVYPYPLLVHLWARPPLSKHLKHMNLMFFDGVWAVQEVVSA